MNATISLVILGIVLFLFVTEWLNPTTVAVLACVAYVITGVCDFSDAFSGFSNNIVILVFGIMVVGDAVFETKLADKIGILVSHLARNNEMLIIVFSAIVGGIMSMWLSNTAVIVLFLAIIRSICAGGVFQEKNLSLPISMGAMFGGVCTLVGSTPQMTTQSIMSEIAGIEFKLFDFLPVGAILFAVYLLYVLLIGRRLGNRIWAGREDEPDTRLIEDSHLNEKLVELGEEAEKRPLGMKGIIMIVILVGMIVSFILEPIPIHMTSSCAALLCVITGCTSHKHALKNMNWDVLIRLAGCLGIARALQVSGSTELVADLFERICGTNVNPTLLLFVVCLLTMIVSNFITNSTAVMIFLPVVLPIVMRLGYSPFTFSLAACYAANLTFATPLANAQTALTMVSGYHFRDYFKYNILLEIFVLAVIVFVVPIIYPFS